ncbi:hypothetical protein LXL04_035233 [Taraxacum kok-saghyz]
MVVIFYTGRLHSSIQFPNRFSPPAHSSSPTLRDLPRPALPFPVVAGFTLPSPSPIRPTLSPLSTAVRVPLSTSLVFSSSLPFAYTIASSDFDFPSCSLRLADSARPPPSSPSSLFEDGYKYAYPAS